MVGWGQWESPPSQSSLTSRPLHDECACRSTALCSATAAPKCWPGPRTSIRLLVLLSLLALFVLLLVLRGMDLCYFLHRLRLGQQKELEARLTFFLCFFGSSNLTAERSSSVIPSMAAGGRQFRACFSDSEYREPVLGATFLPQASRKG